MNPALFLVLATLLIAGALGVVLLPSPVRSAMSLVATLFVMAVAFLLLDAQLVAALQVVVYAGAIMVVLFVIMLLNLQQEPRVVADLGARVGAGFIASLFVLIAIRFFAKFGTDTHGMAAAVPAAFGSTEQLAESLFTRFLFTFEATSLLLLVAIIGAVVLAKKSLS